jgi:3-deoxy-D-manno-octulosonate 8-phosphate phosphatase (KDO 8-P phosphatase)
VRRLSPKLREKAKRIKLLLLDVDGVLTDGRIIMDDTGKELKHFDVRDGYGIRLIIRSGIQVGIMTGRFSKVVRHRAKDLGIRMVFQKVHRKMEVYEKIKKKSRLSDREIAYMGDDIVDLPVLGKAGLAVTVRDAWEGLMKHVDYVTRRKGGEGAVRELVEIVLQAQEKWEVITKSYSK